MKRVKWGVIFLAVTLLAGVPAQPAWAAGETETSIYAESTAAESTENLTSDTTEMTDPADITDAPEVTDTTEMTDVQDEPEETVPAAEVLTEAVVQKTLMAGETEIRAFVERLYQLCLGRGADSVGLNDWTSSLQNKTKSGAEVAAGFIFSQEYIAKKTSDEDYVEMLYRVMLGRNSDTAGKQDWVNRLYNGHSRQGIFAGFVYSTEFTSICASYNITRGDYKSDDIRDKNPNVTAFVSRLYRTCLNRNPDETGLKDWITRLLNGNMQGGMVAWSFLNSKEFIARGINNSDFVDVLYQVFLNRSADATGKKDWVDALNSGMSRMWATGGFAGSQEFQKLCASYGIQAGGVTSTEARDRNRGMTALVNRFYTEALKRTPGASDLNYWTQRLLDKSASGLDLTLGFFMSNEYQNKKTSNAQFVTDLYACLLGRTPDTAGLNSWVSALNSGTSRQALCTQIVESAEFQKLCNQLGILRVANGWADGTYYYQNGQKLSGWQTIDGARYYFNPANNNAKQTGWGYVDGYKLYFGSNGILVTDLESIIGMQSSYVLKVNKQANVVTVYAKDGSNGYIIPVKSFICSTGEATPLGVFSTPNKYRWHELMGPCWGQWCTRINGGVLFHSVFYNSYNNNMNLSISAYNKLGTTASHGCVRLKAGDAKWIYDNCSLGTTVTVYNSSTPGPYGKPTAYKLASWHSWDPTDPTAYYKCQQNGCH